MQAIREIRKQRGLSLRRLAKLAGINHSTLVHIENGKQSPNVTTLEKLADAMDCEVGDFFPKREPSLFGEWQIPPVQGGREAKTFGNPPPPEQGGPEPVRGNLAGAKPYMVPAPREWLMPRLQRLERGEITADKLMEELEEYSAT